MRYELSMMMVMAAAALVFGCGGNDGAAADDADVVSADLVADIEQGQDVAPTPDTGGDQPDTAEDLVDDTAAEEVEDSAAPPDGTVDPDVGIAMVEVPAGDFDMGSPEDEVGRDDNEDLHLVTLSAFEIGVTEVTQAQFEEWLEFNPSDPEHLGCLDCPVDRVSWNDAALFTNALSAAAGLELCYDCSDVEGVMTCSSAISPAECAGYRLPTEAEWERTARAGTTTAFPNGANIVPGTEYDWDGNLVLDNGEELDSFAWYIGNSGGKSHPVAQLAANDWDVHDMNGNMFEWCHDWYAEYDGDATNPHGPHAGDFRVTRGGSFNAGPMIVRSAYRNWQEPQEQFYTIGFRVARTLSY